MSAEYGILEKDSNDSLIKSNNNSFKEQTSQYKIESIDINQLSDHEIVLVSSIDASEKRDNIIEGIFLYLVGIVFLSSSTFLVKVAYVRNEKLNTFDYMLVRSFILVIITIIQSVMLKVNIFDIKKEGRKWLIMRWVLGAIAMPWFFMGIKYLPSSKAYIIGNMHPMLVSIAAIFFLDEIISVYQLLAVAAAFGGIVVMNLTKTSSDKIDTSDKMMLVGIILCATSTTLAVFVTITIKKMNMHLHYMLNSWYFAYTLFALSIGLVIFRRETYNFSTYEFNHIKWFGFSGISHYCGQTITSMAYAKADASKITPFTYSSGLLLMVVDIFLFQYRFSKTDILGMGIVILALVVNYFLSIRSK